MCCGDAGAGGTRSAFQTGRVLHHGARDIGDVGVGDLCWSLQIERPGRRDAPLADNALALGRRTALFGLPLTLLVRSGGEVEGVIAVLLAIVAVVVTLLAVEPAFAQLGNFDGPALGLEWMVIGGDCAGRALVDARPPSARS